VSFQSVQRLGFELSEKEYMRATDEIMKAYRETYRTIRARLEKVYLSFEKVNPEDYYITMIKFDRLNRLLKDVSDQYSAMARATGKMQADASRLAVEANYYRQLYLVDWVDANSVFTILPKAAIELSATGSQKIWQEIGERAREKYKNILPQYGTLSQLLNDNRTDILNRLKRDITNGLIAGDTFAALTRKIRKTMNTAAFNASRIARTEGIRNLNAGNYLSTLAAKDKGIDIVRTWDASLDSRTRPSHGAADGQEENAQGNFNVGGASGPYPGHLSDVGENVNCRCSVINVVEGIRPQARRARDPVTGKTDIISYKSYTDWAKEKGIA
jgi:SPP1 gp7 family putative phage head morphogenesis protein